MTQKNRKLKNLLVAPGLQLKLSLYHIVTGITFFAAIVTVAYLKLLKVGELMNSNTEMDFFVQTQVNDLMFEIVQITLGGFIAYIAVTSIIALIISHRIAGPLVAIKAYIGEMKKGNFEYTRTLRPNDELKDVMADLKELSAILVERDKSI